jgi:hypothetical protein
VKTDSFVKAFSKAHYLSQEARFQATIGAQWSDACLAATAAAQSQA